LKKYEPGRKMYCDKTGCGINRLGRAVQGERMGIHTHKDGKIEG